MSLQVLLLVLYNTSPPAVPLFGAGLSPSVLAIKPYNSVFWNGGTILRLTRADPRPVKAGPLATKIARMSGDSCEYP